MAKQYHAQDIVDLVLALSGFFRISLSQGKEFITLEQEVLMVKNYLDIQKVRYEDLFEYKTEIEEGLGNYMVLKICLQPLVENAIIHGVSPKEEGGSIRIVVRQKEMRLHIVIGDDGIGMTEEELQQLKSRLKTDDARHSGIGLGNVYRRITAMYADGNFEIYSKKNAGTVIFIDIPCREETGDMT